MAGTHKLYHIHIFVSKSICFTLSGHINISLFKLSISLFTLFFHMCDFMTLIFYIWQIVLFTKRYKSKNNLHTKVLQRASNYSVSNEFKSKFPGKTFVIKSSEMKIHYIRSGFLKVDINTF